MIKKAAFAKELGDGKVQCLLCPAKCRLTPEKKGICTSRYNQKGTLVTDNYGELISLSVDPIEKKPLYHFYPGSTILSTGPNYCNMGCVYCQNWSISQKKAPTRYLSPEDLVQAAIDSKSIGVAFTYTEPVIWYEYIMDTAPLLQQAGLKAVLISNGYINPEPLDKLLEYIDAVNIDLKSIRPEFYRKICKSKLEPVQHSIKKIAEAGVHLEITNLIIPTLNDSDNDLNDLFDFVASVSELIPLHLSAYYPSYRLHIPATPAETMLRAWKLAKKRLKYVYVGNLMLAGTSNTYCPNCGTLLVSRSGYTTEVLAANEGKCSECGIETGIIQ
ncbi:MAG: AmmeMemoRadiSam system radical SAM enzyme [candidate division Zixibacteria bacterium]|nr:AmmeMemoRadiSam system radical SAM enzyme [candidate division Zixibacteria bacterium]